VRSESKQYATFRNLLFMGGAASALSIGLAPAAFAQDEAETVEKVTVTGTRIPQKNLVTTSPVTQVTSEDVDTQGVTRLEDLANELPQVFAAQNSTVSNGATGSANINLRGLGSARTLVLINGRRLPYGNPFNSAGDVNGIPSQLVDRVEVLTGGASAVYGSDALSGVVNFIMRKDYEGVNIDAQYGYYSHHNDFDGTGNLRAVIAARAATNPAQFQLPPDDVDDGISKQITGVMGVSNSDGTGNITAYIGYRSNDQILQRDRDYSACALGNQNAAGNWTCGGSSTSYAGRFTDFAGGYDFTIDIPTNVARPFSAALDQYNYGPLNFYQRPDETYTLGAFMHYQIDEQVEAYLDIMFSDYSSISQIAPSGDFFSTNTINCGNPYLNGAAGAGAFSAAQLSAMGCTPAAIASNLVVPMYIGRRNVEGGGRQQDLGFETYRMSGGFRGEVVPGLDYDLALQYSKVRYNQTYLNDLSVTRLNRSLNVVNTGPDGILGNADDAPICQATLNGTDPNCVPWNIFQIGGVTQAAIDYLNVPLFQRATLDQRVATFAMNADLGTWGVKSPWAESPVQAVLGAEWRRDYLTSVTDENFATGNASGQGGPTIGLTGSVDVAEYFGEMQVPLLEDQEFAKLVSIDFAYRYSDYDSGTTTDTWKIGAEWAPTDDIRFRASKQRSVRAANIIELFTAQGFNLFDMDDDPCDLNDPATDGTAPVAACQGVNPWQVTAAQATAGGLNSPAGQYNFLQGGNTALSPEIGDTKTIGFVFTPTFFDNFVLSVDWFNIEIADTISTTGAVNTINACYFGGDLASCNRIVRNAGTGQLWIGTGRVEDLNTNIGSLETTGVDINAQYRFDLDDVGMDGSGGMRLELIGTWLDEIITDPGIQTGASPYDCAGLHSGRCNASVSPVNPEWRHRFRATWQTPWDADLNVTWRYYGSVTKDGGAPNELEYEFDAENYFDISASIGLPLNSRLRLGMNNVFDNDPPVSDTVGTTGNGNTYPQIYEARGRWMFMGLAVDM